MMRYLANLRPTCLATDAPGDASCMDLAKILISLTKCVDRLGSACGALAWFPALGRTVDRYHAQVIEQKKAIFEQILHRFEPVLFDACAAALPPGCTADLLESKIMRISMECKQRKLNQPGCLAEMLWKSAARILPLDPERHGHLHRKMHLRVLFDFVQGDAASLGALRRFAFESSAENRRQQQPGEAARAYSEHQESFRKGIELFANALCMLRNNASELTCGAITDKDLQDPHEALILIESSMCEAAHEGDDHVEQQ